MLVSVGSLNINKHPVSVIILVTCHQSSCCTVCFRVSNIDVDRGVHTCPCFAPKPG